MFPEKSFCPFWKQNARDFEIDIPRQLEMAAKEEDITFPTYAHPSYNEGLLEAVEGLIGQAIHAAPVRRRMQDLSRR